MWMFFIAVIIFLFLETDSYNDRFGHVLGQVMFHGFMLMVTGGLWTFWLLFKVIKKSI